MPESLPNTTAVVTGASSGIGAAIAKALAAEGASVALLARRRERLEALAGALEHDPTVHPVDVRDPNAVRHAIDEVVRSHGGIDLLVNNAGYGTMRPAFEADLGEWQAMVDINIKGVLATTHAALPHLATAANGARGIADVVTISSVGGRKITTPESNVYAATKHAVGAFSEALRQECAARQVRVGLVEPGLVHTELTEDPDQPTPNIPDHDRAVLQPEDIAEAAVFMATRPTHCAVNELLVRPLAQQR